MSNTRKITANKKNRMEKGIRAVDIGSNPHSNGDIFSRSFKVCREAVILIINRRLGIIRPNIKIEIVEYIKQRFHIQIKSLTLWLICLSYLFKK